MVKDNGKLYIVIVDKDQIKVRDCDDWKIGKNDLASWSVNLKEEVFLKEN